MISTFESFFFKFFRKSAKTEFLRRTAPTPLMVRMNKLQNYVDKGVWIREIYGLWGLFCGEKLQTVQIQIWLNIFAVSKPLCVVSFCGFTLPRPHV
ncbi:hypothetical protein GDO86_020436 [Hymenochirus boettgeri]|uniref:Uncharacterized protein n=1 Tax=Hymenochirus boettgeri TaxID=247094 RepID=A0A8T2IDQ5_9PIPI|nr:hypothetical protein GDO86_020436 [Hymenochirus boettgeri]